MNSTSIKEAAAVAYPRDKMIGVWWSGAEPDVIPAGDQATGYKALMLQHGAGKFTVHADIEKHRDRQGQGARQGRHRPGALQSRPDQLDARRRGDPHGAEEVRQQAADRRAGALGLREPQPHRRRASRSSASRACSRRSSSPAPTTRAPIEARVQQWDGKAWKVISDWYTADQQILDADGQGRRRPSTRRRRRSRRATAPRRAEARCMLA